MVFCILKKVINILEKTKKFILEPDWGLDILLQTEKNINYSKSSFKFSDQEILKGKELLKKFGLNENDKWVCIHNRDSNFYLMVKLISLITIIEIFSTKHERCCRVFCQK